MSYALDVESFLKEIAKYPELYNINLDANRHRTKKMAAWGRVARVFIPDFDQLDARGKNEVYRKLFSKWRNIRDQYVRHRKNRAGKKKRYVYAEYMHFLDPIYDTKIGSDEEQDCNETEESDDGEEKQEKKNVKIVTSRSKEKAQLEISSEWHSDDPSQSIKGENSANIEYVDTPLLDASCSYGMDDEDKSFFDSLLPAVRDLDIDQKLEFRSEVLKLLRNVRKLRKRIKPDPEDNGF